MKPHHPDREILPIEVFAGTNIQAAMLKSMLDDAQIYSFLKDEIMGTLNPWYTDAGGAGPVRVIVSSTDEEEAREIVSLFEHNIQHN